MATVAGASAPLTEKASWKALQAHYEKIRGLHLRDLFSSDPGRGERFTTEGPGIFLDYSKNRINDETVRLLVALAEESGLRQRIDAMFSGEKINVTEKRAVLHVACAHPRVRRSWSTGENVVPQVHAGARQDGCILGAGAQRRVEGALPENASAMW